jgi:hypothetical protein
MLGRLGSPAAGNKNGMILPIGFVRPKKMMIRTTSLRVLPELTVLFEIIDRPRIRITIVEVLDLLCHVIPPSAVGFSAATRFHQFPLNCRRPGESISLH